VRCPRCQTVNSTEAQPAQQHHLPSFLPSFGGHHVAPAPQHQPQHRPPVVVAPAAQPAQQQQGYINY